MHNITYISCVGDTESSNENNVVADLSHLALEETEEDAGDVLDDEVHHVLRKRNLRIHLCYNH